MGCDIHAAIEYHEFSNDSQWDTFAVLCSEPRWYRLFGALTNGAVRGDAVSVLAIDPRGFPKDAGWETGEAYGSDGADAHTPSWLSAEEFCFALDAMEEKDAYWETVKVVLLNFAVKWPTRFVFWFDN